MIDYQLIAEQFKHSDQTLVLPSLLSEDGVSFPEPRVRLSEGIRIKAGESEIRLGSRWAATIDLADQEGANSPDVSDIQAGPTAGMGGGERKLI